ncbi:glycosyltransferase family 4 protein [Streptomyces sp. TLI_185]|uniref:glycosyltransferase family 4 protein n=1 Tax=Streptomyces sp. TLI_185 TaxID=2485151 RepID=UPI000F515032|nr:glycosyltransferase family 4 protein [Streptomyces sp. TLI_185]RPF38095.1 glycosyltransferase involved in cell wall biosynthesis [Streptomyces sp. TLI_185]
MTARWMPAPPPVAEPGQLPARPPRHRLKVLHVITRLEAGAGGNTLVSALGMDPRRYEVWIAAGGRGPLWDRAQQEGMRTVRIPEFRREVSPARDVAVLVRLVRLIRAERFAVVHVHEAKAGFLGRLAAALCGTPVVVITLHGRDPWWRTASGSGTDLREVMPHGLPLYSALERMARPLTDAFVAVAPTVARDAVQNHIATAGRTDVAASAVDFDAIPYGRDPSVRAALGIGDGDTVVGMVGRLDPQKAPLDFVRMAARVAVSHPRTRFVVVGDGEQNTQMRQLAAKLGVDMVFTGFRQDAPRIASAFDVFVVSSLYEGVGRSVTEAMASGRPVVATAVDGVVDVVTHGSTGLLAEPRDPQGLAARVVWLLDHPQDAARMGEQARDLVRTLFAPKRMCTVLDEIYSSLLGCAPLPPPEPTKRLQEPDGTSRDRTDDAAAGRRVDGTLR